MSAANQLRQKTKRRWPARLLRWAAALLVVMGIVALVCGFLMYATPKWYQPMSATDDGVENLQGNAQKDVLELANRFDNAAFTETTWTITQDEINAELAAPTLHWPGVSAPMIIFAPGKVTVCARVKGVPGGDPAGGVVTVELKVQTVAGSGGNDLLIALERVYAGKLRVPQSVVRRVIEPQLAGLGPKVHQALLMNSGETTAREYSAMITEWIDHAVSGQAYRPHFVRRQRPVILKEVRVEDGRITFYMAPGVRPGP